MLKFGLFAIVGIVFLVGTTTAYTTNTNGRYLATIVDLFLNFPRYLEEILNLELDKEGQQTNSTDRFLLRNNVCFRDFLRIFTGLARRKLWAIKGILILFPTFPYKFPSIEVSFQP